MPGKQRPLKASQAGCCDVRAIRSKLYCLKSNLQPVNTRTRRNGACNRRRAMRWRGIYVDATSMTRAMLSEGIKGDKWTAYVALDTYNKDVPRDCLWGASPRVTECE
jgi:hypothetical protein